ncbi:MAG TPA: hypothetical protein VLD63_04665 [Anaerolineales bacterium]|nr:hypothetical protein [Anaerolineales bacterium]
MTKRSRSMASRPAPRSMASTDFQPDYSHIRSDLRRIGVIAGTFVVLLLVASFFVR